MTSKFKRPLLYALVASVLAGALLSIYLVLLNRWGDFEIKVILTTVTIAVASIGGLACEQAKTPRGRNVLPWAGMVLTLLTAILMLIGIWGDPRNEEFWKTTFCFLFFAVATVHVCLLSLARLASRFSWVFFVAMQMIFGLATLLAIMLIWEEDSEQMMQFVSVVSILVAGVTLVIPLLHRISKGELPPAEMLSPLNQRNLAEIDHELAQLKQQVAALEKLRAELVGQTGEKLT